MEREAYQVMAETEATHWWFVGRRRILERVIRTAVPQRQGLRILELGCGTGGNLAMLGQFGTVSAMELDDEARAIALSRAGQQLRIERGRCPDALPYPGEQFDLICLLDVLEHIAEDEATLAAATERLAPGGVLLITVPAYTWLWSAHDEALHHLRRYSKSRLLGVLASVRLRIDCIGYFNSLLFPLAVLARIADRLQRRKHASGVAMPAPWLNGLLRFVFELEARWWPRFRLPFGVSLIAVLRRDAA